MNDSDFSAVVQRRIKMILESLDVKAKEYARGDRLHNFKRAADLKQETPEKALIGFWTKHLVSLLDMVDDLDRGVNHPAKLWDEKITDAVNYLVLLEALIVERGQRDK